MTESRLESKDVKVLLLWVLVGLIGVAIAFKYFFDIIACGIEREQSADTKHHT